MVEFTSSKFMSTPAPAEHAHIEVLFAGRPRQDVPITALPFLIGRGRENGNHLALDDLRISRRCVAISSTPGGLCIEDRGQLGGVFVNGDQVTDAHGLHNGDRIRLGTDNECQLLFRWQAEKHARDPEQAKLHSLVDSGTGDSHFELNRLNLLLQATSLLHSQLPLESILAAMLDHAIAITRADRGMLLEPDGSGVLQVRVARGRERESLVPGAMNPSRTVLGQAVEQRSAVINEDLRLADLNVQTAQSVVLQFLRSAVVIPLYSMPPGEDTSSPESSPDGLLGAVYLDSKREAAFSALDRQILDALGAQAASILDNARLVQHERDRQRLEQELSIARQIQQALVPQGLTDYPHCAISGLHRPCEEVGGDYFDVFPLPDGRITILIADVAGKGLGAALVTTMLQGAISAMSLGIEPEELIEHLNRFLCQRAMVDRCVTMFIGVLDADGYLEFVRAGHPSPLLLRRGDLSELYHEGSFPIGLVAESSFTSTRIALQPGDTMLLYTDGVTEAADKDRNLYGTPRLTEAFKQYGNLSLDAVQGGIFRAVEEFAGESKQWDDITLVAVRYRKAG